MDDDDRNAQQIVRDHQDRDLERSADNQCNISAWEGDLAGLGSAALIAGEYGGNPIVASALSHLRCVLTSASRPGGPEASRWRCTVSLSSPGEYVSIGIR